jgi:DUF4097 and DUF4098 domain-containing protein YvlB
MSTFIINGKTFVTEGNADSISVNNGQVFLNGRTFDMGEFASAPVINIVVEGSVNSVSTQSGDVTVKGDLGTAKTMSGNIEVDGAVKGDVSTMSGDVRVAGSIAGKVKTVSGDIRSKG